MAEELSGNGDMVASYEVQIVGIQRTKNELAKLSREIANLRAGRYSETKNVTFGGGDADIFATKMDQFEGRVQTAIQRSMILAMDMGKSTQAQALRAAATSYGQQRYSGGRGNSAGRDDTGDMIKALKRNVEVGKTVSTTFITGWHGWSQEGTYYEYQERGTRGRGGASKADAKKGGAIYRSPNKVDKRRAGQKNNTNMGVPGANSLGATIIPVREFLKRELGGLKR